MAESGQETEDMQSNYSKWGTLIEDMGEKNSQGFLNQYIKHHHDIHTARDHSHRLKLVRVFETKDREADVARLPLHGHSTNHFPLPCLPAAHRTSRSKTWPALPSPRRPRKWILSRKRSASQT